MGKTPYGEDIGGCGYAVAEGCLWGRQRPLGRPVSPRQAGGPRLAEAGRGWPRLAEAG